MPKKLLLLFLAWELHTVNCAFSQITCDVSGNVVLYSNYDGGVLDINVDVNIPNLKIGVVSYEMVTINLSGPFVNNITEVRFAGYTTTTHQHCSNTPSVTSIVGAPPGTDTLVFMPASPVSNANGYYIIICNYSCDTATSQGGCNTPDQIAAYFQQEFGGLLRYHFTQYGCWNGTYNISDGGNCCVSALTPAPVALFSSDNHICPGTCTDFTNLSTNASSYSWSFPGASPSSSTDINPAGICYTTPGSYDVSLIAGGPGGSDTVTLSNYITVYPFPPPQGIQQSGDTLFANPGATTYQWYFNGSVIPGATGYYYVATQNGDYNVICTDENGCEVETVIFGVLTEVADNGLNGKQQLVFPNPVREKLYVIVNAPGGTVHWISIHNAIGEKLHSFQVPAKAGNFNPLQTTVDVSQFNPGIYWIELRSSSDVIRNKFVKE